MFWKDNDRRFIGANQRLLMFHGISLDQLIGKSTDEMDWVIDKKTYAELETDVLKNGKSVQVPISINVNGKVKHVMLFEAPIFSNGEIIGLFGIYSDVTSINDKLRKLEKAALRDALTGLRNRRTLSSDLSHLMGHKLFIMMLDIDHFKSFNDTYGHRYGDEVLRILSHALDNTYGFARCYRYGGDEFLIIGAYTSLDDVRHSDHSFRMSLKAQRIIDITMSINTSCGVAFGSPSSREEIESLINEADKNLYRAKNNGRNQTYYGSVD